MRRSLLVKDLWLIDTYVLLFQIRINWVAKVLNVLYHCKKQNGMISLQSASIDKFKLAKLDPILIVLMFCILYSYSVTMNP